VEQHVSVDRATTSLTTTLNAKTHETLKLIRHT
jgi:hypothetical protein